MRKLIWTAVLFGAASAWAQPVLRATDPVVNGGSYANTIAPGCIFVIFGTNIAGSAITTAPVPYPAALAGVSVRFAPKAGGAAVDARMVYTTQNQISGLLPSSAAVGDYNVTVTYNGQTSAPGTATVVARNFGIVSADSSGAGQAQATTPAYDLNRYAKGTLGPFKTTPAIPGDTLVFWGTGIGADDQSDVTGGSSGDRTAAANVRVLVSGKEVMPLYAGRSTGYPGLDQVNFTLPGDTPTGCSIQVQVKIGTVLSNAVTVAVVSPGQDICQSPNLSSEALRRLSAGGTLVLGNFTMTKTSVSINQGGISLDTGIESIDGEFARYTTGNVASYGSSTASGSVVTVGSCVVARIVGDQNAVLSEPPPASLLDAGASLRLTGPNNVNVSVLRGPTATNTVQNYYSYTQMIMGSIPGLPPGVVIPGAGTSFISPGTFTLTGTGGADVGAFTTSLTIPEPLVWTNKDSIASVVRSQNLPITWTGGGSNDLMIFGMAGNKVGGTTASPIFDMAVFYCLTKANLLNFTVPSAILTQLPATGDVTTGNSIGMLGLQLSAQSTFTAPLTAGGSIDGGTIGFSTGSSKLTPYQ